MRILQINVTANSGSTGRIAEGIGIAALSAGHESWIAYGRHANKSASHLIRIGSKINYLEHGVESRLLDNHGLASRHATRSFLKEVDKIKPDLIHLHNIHGYYLNYKILFDYLREKSIPVVWTFHDCWPFTGHCTHFSLCGCDRWKTGCSECPEKRTYPTSYCFDRSVKNFEEKKEQFNSIQKMTIVSVSRWLDNLVSQSFLKGFDHIVIHNGIDTDAFSPSSTAERIRIKHNIRNDETMLLGVASDWNPRKGLLDFIKLSEMLSPKEKIVLIGLTKKQIYSLPHNIIGLERTESIKQLAEYYSAADLFLNLTYEDNYPTTNLESISCGTPCLTYRTGGSPESITPETGFIVPQGNTKGVLQEICFFQKNKSFFAPSALHQFAKDNFCLTKNFHQYMTLYHSVLHT